MGPTSTMYINRPVPQRPQMPHRATDMSARKVNPRAAYGPPLVVQQEKPKTVLSARALPKSAKFSDHDEDEEDDSEEDSEDYSEDSETEEEFDPRAALIEAARLKQYHEFRKRQHEVQLLEQRKAEAMIAAQKAKEQAAKVAMPPPQRPASAVTGGFSMRRPKNEASPMITYGDNLSQQVRQAFAAGARPHPTPTGAPKAPSYPVVMPGSRANFAADEAFRHQRRGSVYSSESLAELEARERALKHSFDELERQREELRREELHRQRRESRGATPGYDHEALRASLRSLDLGAKDSSTEDLGMNDRLSKAQSYIEKRRDSNTQPQLTAGILRKSGLDRETTSIRSKRSSKEGSSTTGTRRRASIIDPEEKYDGEGLKMRIDAKQDYEIEFGGNRIELRPNEEGHIDFYVAGKRESQYHSSKASSVGGSKIGRRLSRRARIVDEDSVSEAEEEDDYDTPRERHSVRGGAARRRAETVSTYNAEPRRRHESLKVPASAERPKRSALRQPPVVDDDRSRRGQVRRPGTPEEDYYRGPPIYGAAPDEYNRYNQGYGRYESSSSRPSYGYGSMNQNYQGFGA